MAENSNIEWTDHTFNPVRGCKKVSPACKNCYAETRSKRFGEDFANQRIVLSHSGWKAPLKWNNDASMRVAVRSRRGVSFEIGDVVRLENDGDEAIDVVYDNDGSPSVHGKVLDIAVVRLMNLYGGKYPEFVVVRVDETGELAELSRRNNPKVFCASLGDVFEDWGGLIHNSHGDVIMQCPNGHVDGGRWDNPPSSIECSHECGEDMRPMTMGDVRTRLFQLIDDTPNLDWLLLTKRPENIIKMWPRYNYDACATGDCHHERADECGIVLDRENVWLGVTVENQEMAHKRIPELLKCRDLAARNFLSCEPLLGDVLLSEWLFDSNSAALGDATVYEDVPSGNIDWVIAGGESGPIARPSHPDWFRSIRDQCQGARVPFHFKQWGEYADAGSCDGGDLVVYSWDDGAISARIGKGKAGRLLDGRTWDDSPCST